MDGILEIGGFMLSQASQRMEVAAQNVSNMATPGYRAQKIFSSLLHMPESVDGTSLPSLQMATDFSSGKMIQTGNSYDLALSGDGFLMVRAGDQIFYTRSGQFSRDGDGRLVDGSGGVLQSEDGDIVLQGQKIKIENDGTVLDDGEPVSRIAVMNFRDASALTAAGNNRFTAASGVRPERIDTLIHQGMLESSNVSTAQEMIAIMASTRSAETGQRLVQVYDDLMGRALTAFGQVQA
jgi:flagellar basal-body rod protein FlgF